MFTVLSVCICLIFSNLFLQKMLGTQTGDEVVVMVVGDIRVSLLLNELTDTLQYHMCSLYSFVLLELRSLYT